MPVTARENMNPVSENTLVPSDFTDVGQANLLVREYGDGLRYNSATDWLVFDGVCWRENRLDAQARAQLLTERQIAEAATMKRTALEREMNAKRAGNAELENLAKQEKATASKYYSYALGRRKSAAISAALTEARPALQVDIKDLDAAPFLLNTPSGTVDLKTGELRPHHADDLCTKCTGASPNENGRDLFLSFLSTITTGDEELARYLQIVAGMFAVGAVFTECLTIAYGSGRNGKSTFFNLLGRVLGDYSGSLSAEVLTVNCRRNKSPEYAELRGKRFVVASELEEGVRLDTAIVKKLCSTDPIYAEKKYKDPFSFVPSHSILLFTNHLPKVGTSDAGTWRRLVVIPFKATISDAGDIKNYAEYLFHHAGGAVLSWIIDGARLFIANGYKIDAPRCVQEAIEAYRVDNDWLQAFLTECCEIAPNYRQPSKDLYTRYQSFCALNMEYMRSSADFRRAVEEAGYSYKRANSCMMVHGLMLKQPAMQLPFTSTNEPTPWD